MEFKFIGHCYDPKENHDKVWGVIFLDDSAKTSRQWYSYTKCLAFWGRRGKKLQTMEVIDDSKLSKLISAKTNKGYKEVGETRLDEVYPDFEADLKKTAMWALLKF